MARQSNCGGIKLRELLDNFRTMDAALLTWRLLDFDNTTQRNWETPERRLE
jgi:hypothetical protein